MAKIQKNAKYINLLNLEIDDSDQLSRQSWFELLENFLEIDKFNKIPTIIKDNPSNSHNYGFDMYNYYSSYRSSSFTHFLGINSYLNHHREMIEKHVDIEIESDYSPEIKNQLIYQESLLLKAGLNFLPGDKINYKIFNQLINEDINFDYQIRKTLITVKVENQEEKEVELNSKLLNFSFSPLLLNESLLNNEDFLIEQINKVNLPTQKKIIERLHLPFNAAFCGQKKLLELILKIDKDYANSRNYFKQTPVMITTNEEIVELLLDHTNVKLTDLDNQGILEYITNNRLVTNKKKSLINLINKKQSGEIEQEKLIKSIIESVKNKKSSKTLPNLLAMYTGDINDIKDEQKNNLLSLVLKIANYQLVERLIKKKINIKQSNLFGVSPFDYFVYNGIFMEKLVEKSKEKEKLLELFKDELTDFKKNSGIIKLLIVENNEISEYLINNYLAPFYHNFFNKKIKDPVAVFSFHFNAIKKDQQKIIELYVDNCLFSRPGYGFVSSISPDFILDKLPDYNLWENIITDKLNSLKPNNNYHNFYLSNLIENNFLSKMPKLSIFFTEEMIKHLEKEMEDYNYKYNHDTEFTFDQALAEINKAKIAIINQQPKSKIINKL